MSKRCAAGFTLLEVLAALVIVSLGMLAVITTVSQTANNGAYLRDKTIAHWVAMNRLTEVRLQGAQPRIDKSSDEVEMGGRRWRWTMNVTQTPVETIRRIDVSVRPEDAPENSSMASVTGFHGAAIAPPGSVLVFWEGGDKQAGPGGRSGQQEDPDEDQGQQNGADDDEPPDSAPRGPGDPLVDPSDPTGGG